jgi:hypothetical protein
MKAREIFRRMSGKTRAPGARRIPDNSELWLPGGVHSVADALYISDRIKETMNEMEVSGFEEVWNRATPQSDGTRLPDVVDLLITKLDTYDIQFLEGKAEEMYLERLPQARPDEAPEMLSRFLNPKVAEAAARHDHPEDHQRGETARGRGP